MKADGLTVPVLKEESTRVYGALFTPSPAAALCRQTKTPRPPQKGRGVGGMDSSLVVGRRLGAAGLAGLDQRLDLVQRRDGVGAGVG